MPHHFHLNTGNQPHVTDTASQFAVRSYAQNTALLTFFHFSQSDGLALCHVHELLSRILSAPRGAGHIQSAGSRPTRLFIRFASVRLLRHESLQVSRYPYKAFTTENICRRRRKTFADQGRRKRACLSDSGRMPKNTPQSQIEF